MIPTWIHANIHTRAYNHSIGTNKGNQIEVEEPWADFHLYALEWYEDRMDFFLDDSLYFTFENDQSREPRYLALRQAPLPADQPGLWGKLGRKPGSGCTGHCPFNMKLTM
jgi:hypothetical protein